MKPYIGDITYNMQYKQYSKILSQKVQQAKGCKGYKEFVEDVALLRKTRKNCGKPSILANNYKKGMLDPYQYEPKERDFSKENGLMDEDEEEFIGGI